MSLSVKFHHCIDKYNILETPTEIIAKHLKHHPTTYKIALLIFHLFRAAMVVGLMFIPHLPLYARMIICFSGSLAYRLIVEKKCPYKFALPAFFGAAAFMLALPAIISMINQTAFLTVGGGFKAVSSLLPLSFYGIYILLTVDYDVNANLAKNTCECEDA